MNQCPAKDRSFSLLITVHKGEVINDLCAVLPHESFVEYEPSDLEWLIPLGLVDVIRLPESLVRDLSEKASQALFDYQSLQPCGDFAEIQQQVLESISESLRIPPQMFEEGAICHVPRCGGTLGFRDVENCCCHISPPCHRCVDNPLVCLKCGEG